MCPESTCVPRHGARKLEAPADLSGHVAVVAGASYGTGRLIATGLLDAGADVVAAGPTSVSSAIRRFGRLDIVVNYATAAHGLPRGRMTPEMLQRVYDDDVRSPQTLVDKALPQLRRSPCASVINVISRTGPAWPEHAPLYATVKLALLSQTASLAVRHSRDGVRVNMLALDTGRCAAVAAQAVFLASAAARHLTGQVVDVCCDGSISNTVLT